MRILIDLLLTACYFILPFCLSAAAADDSWQNLKHFTHERFYTVVDGKSNCITGRIDKVNDRELRLKLPNQTSATFDCTNVVRVSVSQAAPYFPLRVQADVGRVYDVIYSNKSSWSDLKGVAGQEKMRIPGQEAKVVKTDGKTYEGRLSKISPTQLQLDRKGGKFEIAKTDVAQIYYLRPKPLTDSVKYSAQEDFWIDPRLWPYYFHLVPRLPVRLYDSSLPEDDSPVRCESDSKEKVASEFCFSGYVQSIDLSNVTLQRPGREAETVQLSKNTSVRVLARPSAVGDIKVGDEIIVCGSVENGEAVGQRITVRNTTH